jgi:hypothetical protein
MARKRAGLSVRSARGVADAPQTSEMWRTMRSQVQSGTGKGTMRGAAILAGGAIALAITGAGLLVLRGQSGGPDEAAIRAQTTAALRLELSMPVLPEGSIPGHMTPAAVAEVHRRISEDLPRVMTGPLLEAQTRGYTDWLSQIQSDEAVGASTDAGIDSISFDRASISGDSATIRGDYSWHMAGCHAENGVRVDEGVIRGSSPFTAELVREGGVWRVSVIHLLQAG